MPAKRRKPKQRLSAAAELEMWSMAFECGHDWVGDLEPLGFRHGPRDGGADVRRAAQEAWGRLGAMFLEQRPPKPFDTRPVPAHLVGIVCMKPWALYEFGEP